MYDLISTIALLYMCDFVRMFKCDFVCYRMLYVKSWMRVRCTIDENYIGAPKIELIFGTIISYIIPIFAFFSQFFPIKISLLYLFALS